MKITPCALDEKVIPNTEPSSELRGKGGEVQQPQSISSLQPDLLKHPDECLPASVRGSSVGINAVIVGPYSASTNFFHYIEPSFMIVYEIKLPSSEC